MASKVYDSEIISLLNGKVVKLKPLKIVYLREFMKKFELVKLAKNNDEAIDLLVECALVAMKEFLPSVTTKEELEDIVDLETLYKILDLSAGIKMNQESKKEEISDQASKSKSSWEDLDLAKLEAEAFLLGIWKDYEDLESSLSMPELSATLEAKRELDYQEKKFLAAIQGVDLDKQSGEPDAWEKMKAKVFSGGKTSDPNDIVSFQGAKAQKAGFGVGMGISYEKL